MNGIVQDANYVNEPKNLRKSLAINDVISYRQVAQLNGLYAFDRGLDLVMRSVLHELLPLDIDFE